MNTFIKIFCIAFITTVATLHSVSAAHMYIQSPKTASANREPLSLSIVLDPEGSSVSGLSGDFSFPSELFDVKSITTQNGIVSLWVNQPHVSVEKSFDQRTHINFDGIIPGGFSGVHNPYYKGVYAGILFTVTLIPKGNGSGNFILDNVELHSYDDNATILASVGDIQPVFVPVLSGKEIPQSTDLLPTWSRTITMQINNSELVNNNAPYVYVHENDPARTVDHIEIAESSEYNPNYVSIYEWHAVTNPYVLAYSSRTKYIHAKIVYTDKTYVYKTLPPVENSQAFINLSRILIVILVTISLLLYFYGKHFLHINEKHHTKHN